MSAHPAMAASGPSEEQARQSRQRKRSLAIALALGFLALLFYAVTIVRLGPNAIRNDEFAPPAPEQHVPQAPADADCKKAGTC